VKPELLILAVILIFTTFLLWRSQEELRKTLTERSRLKEENQTLKRYHDENERAIEEAVQTPAPEPASVIPSNYATALKDEDFIRRWKEAERNELYPAVRQLVAKELLEAIDYVTRADLATVPGALQQAQGSLMALMNLAANLDLASTEPERWTAALKKKAR
jgi:molecular chaperone GrpE (heat shock protein)